MRHFALDSKGAWAHNLLMPHNPTISQKRRIDAKKTSAIRTVTVGIPADLHRKVKMLAAETDTSVQAILAAALRAYLGERRAP